MKDFEQITKDLSIFLNISLSKNAWIIVLKGCKLPKNEAFWKYFKTTCLSESDRLYTLISIECIQDVYENYCSYNRAAVNKHQYKKKVKEKAKKIKLPHLVIDPRSGRIITRFDAIENKYEN